MQLTILSKIGTDPFSQQDVYHAQVNHLNNRHAFIMEKSVLCYEYFDYACDNMVYVPQITFYMGWDKGFIFNAEADPQFAKRQWQWYVRACLHGRCWLQEGF